MKDTNSAGFITQLSETLTATMTSTPTALHVPSLIVFDVMTPNRTICAAPLFPATLIYISHPEFTVNLSEQPEMFKVLLKEKLVTASSMNSLS